jgi:hypothetical protein
MPESLNGTAFVVTLYNRAGFLLERHHHRAAEVYKAALYSTEYVYDMADILNRPYRDIICQIMPICPHKAESIVVLV